MGEWREYNLALLHDESHDRAAIAYGFSPKHFRIISETSLQSRVRATFELPIQLCPDLTKQPLDQSLGHIHSILLEDFFASDRFGYVQSPKHTVGFLPHGTLLMQVLLSAGYDGKEPDCQLTRLELVSLLRHDEPRVYIAETIPLMNELEDVPHRALNEFESQALPQLQTERDTVIEETHKGAVMLGAVRAGNDCLQCHNGPRGKLLGAFSYEFRELK